MKDALIDKQSIGQPVRQTPPPPEFLLQRLRFRCQAIDPIRLPYYSGSAWRGVLGHSLRASACVTHARQCSGCLLFSRCVYSRFFETPPDSGHQAGRYTALPHPFVLEPPPAGMRDFAPGADMTLGITLMDGDGDFVPYLVHCLQRAGQRGIGRPDGRFQLLEVTQEASLGSHDWRPIFQADHGVLKCATTRNPPLQARPDPLELEFLTPLRLKERGQLVNEHLLDARALLGALSRRVAQLADLYARDGGDRVAGAGFDPGALHAAIDQVRIEHSALRWEDWTRWSSRQRTRMQLGGLIGRLRLVGPGLEALWPLIALGQWLHLGKSTSFGLGRYRVLGIDHPASTSAAPARPVGTTADETNCP